MRLESFPASGTSRYERLNRTEPPIDLVGDSDAFRFMRCRLEQVAATDATVLLLGETGTGKGLAAHAIHCLSPRRDAPFISVDCTSLPATLIESELFGREKGAFTDARSAQAGRLELAQGGTIFLDEVGELPPEAQAKLLRVLQHREFERLGSPRTIRVDARIIAATNRNLIDEVRTGRFRRDLYYRLNVFPLTLPPLRERRSDIPPLIQHLVKRLADKYHRRIETIPKSVMDGLVACDWPGNIRELENVLERAVITTPDTTLRLLEPSALETPDVVPSGPTHMLVDVERAYIRHVLNATGWRIEGPLGAAAALGLKPSTLRSRMRKLGVKRSPANTEAPPGQMIEDASTR